MGIRVDTKNKVGIYLALFVSTDQIDAKTENVGQVGRNYFFTGSWSAMIYRRGCRNAPDAIHHRTVG